MNDSAFDFFIHNVKPAIRRERKGDMRHRRIRSRKFPFHAVLGRADSRKSMSRLFAERDASVSLSDLASSNCRLGSMSRDVDRSPAARVQQVMRANSRSRAPSRTASEQIAVVPAINGTRGLSRSDQAGRKVFYSSAGAASLELIRSKLADFVGNRHSVRGSERPGRSFNAPGERAFCVAEQSRHRASPSRVAQFTSRLAFHSVAHLF